MYNDNIYNNDRVDYAKNSAHYTCHKCNIYNVNLEDAKNNRHYIYVAYTILL